MSVVITVVESWILLILKIYWITIFCSEEKAGITAPDGTTFDDPSLEKENTNASADNDGDKEVCITIYSCQYLSELFKNFSDHSLVDHTG